MRNRYGIGLVVAGALLVGCSKKVAKVTEEPQAPQMERLAEAAPRNQGVDEDALRRQRMQDLLNEAMKTIYFEYDQAALNERAKQTLARIGDVLKQYPEIRGVTIQGHADERGTEEYNFALGERRANAIKRYLAEYGIGADRLVTVSFGEERPAVRGSGEEAWTQNRRGEFEVNN